MFLEERAEKQTEILNEVLFIIFSIRVRKSDIGV